MTTVAAKDDKKPKDNIPDILCDPGTGKRYLRGRFLGKGGFAKCYELTDMDNKEIWAGKIVPKTLLVKQHQKDKMAQEIAIHRSIGHRHVVRFHTFFEDSNNVYVLLELCRRRSLMELHKRRKAVTEPEARYFIKHITEACQYLHNNHIIHRDLKLGNLFLNDNMEVKVGDFGLATKLDFDGERKKTLCGTPNYIAPEVLGKKGHSYEVDAWSLGCILFTLLVGKPPFETTCLKDTYEKIKKNDYHIPSKVSLQARNLINRLLRANPTDRPSMDQIMQDPFFQAGYLPVRLPTSCLTMEPRFDTLIKEHTQAGDGATVRKPLVEVNGPDRPVAVEPGKQEVDGKSDKAVESKLPTLKIGLSSKEDMEIEYLLDLARQLYSVLSTNPSERANPQLDECEDPAAIPVYWISKWVDYSDKYGLGYQLCDNSVGVLYNDSSRSVLLSNLENMHYIERDGREHYHTIRQYPEVLSKKTGADVTPRDSDEMIRLPFLRTWFRTHKAIVLLLSNGTLQINFFLNHTKVIICPLMAAVTYINENREFRTYRLSLIEKYGCSRDLAFHLSYASAMVERLMAAKRAAAQKAKTLVS
ncbi:unnamed protein product [Candidula unifasciata]|uniref:Serine/threonine-protein kinase PLK n=1 Tax=Candidula unifasciata TaxID=100452 RepID=A0A8S3ZFR0_9EUPU|nr:unnamed protein product [Candidula unifasciata]